MTKFTNSLPNSVKDITDNILYTGKLPDCLSELKECNTKPTLTDLLDTLLEQYCNGNDLKKIDASEIDLTCLFSNNDSISLGRTDNLISLFDVLNFMVQHVCYIYEEYCQICGEDGVSECTITSYTQCTGSRYFGITFPNSINYTSNSETLIDLLISLPANADGSNKTFIIEAETSVSDAIDIIISGWENIRFTPIKSGNVLRLEYNLPFANSFPLSIAYQSPSEMSSNGNLNGFTLTIPGGILSLNATNNTAIYGSFTFSECAIEKSEPICDIIQDHENRITELEYSSTLIGRGVAVFIQEEEPNQSDFNSKYGSVIGFGINGIPGSNTFKPGDIWISNIDEDEV